MRSGWIGVDLDGTLAEFDGEKWMSSGGDWIGPPVPMMVARVQSWLEEGRDVRIMTARVAAVDWQDGLAQAAKQRTLVENWCLEHLSRVLPITATKDYAMNELWDDRAVGVETNTGRIRCSE